MNGKSDSPDAENADRAVLAGFATATPQSADGEAEMIRRTRPTAVLAERAYSSRAIRGYYVSAASGLSVRSPSTRQDTACGGGRRGGRPLGFDREVYRQRNAVERCINRLKR